MKPNQIQFVVLCGLCLFGFTGCRTTAPQHLGSLSSPPPFQTLARTSAGYPPNVATTPIVNIDSSDRLQSLVQQSSGIVLVDFYADWCRPCQKQSQVLEEMQQTASNSGATIVKVNIDQAPQLSEQFEVSGLPTLIVFKNGQILDRQSGLADATKIQAMLTQ